MNMTRINKLKKYVLIPVLAAAIIFIAISPPIAQSDTTVKYTESAHGNSGYGVKRSSITGYAQGLCIHCHESHASVDGVEPAPDTPAGPDNYMLFATNYDSGNALNNVCLYCHSNSTESYQSGGTLANRTYSFRAGTYSAGFDSLTSIKDILNPSLGTNAPLSTHDMIRIQAVMSNDLGFSTNANPCIACHNPHKAKGDPANNPTASKTNATRGWPLSRPSLHARTKDGTYAQWQLWGDDASEKMYATYATQYYDPLRPSGTYEPDGASTQQNGASLTNVIPICTDCHNTTISITSTELGTLRSIDWTNEKHGSGNDSSPLHLRAPYTTGAANKVLSCTDCHEPHGAPNTTLIRGGVNGATIASTNVIQLNPLTGPMGSNQCITSNANYSSKEMAALCIRCHQDDKTADPTNCSTQTNRYYYIHHDTASGDAPFPIASYPTCTNCHTSGTLSSPGCSSTASPINCTCCHLHNATESVTGRRTF